MRVNIARTISGLLTDGATRTGPAIARHSSSGPSPPEAADEGGEDDQRDVAVDVEEGDVETREVSGADERVLVDQERHDRRPAEPEEEPEPGEPAEQRERRRGERVDDARGREGGERAQARGEGAGPLRGGRRGAPAGVDQAEDGEPQREREPEHDRRRGWSPSRRGAPPPWPPSPSRPSTRRASRLPRGPSRCRRRGGRTPCART